MTISQGWLVVAFVVILLSMTSKNQRLPNVQNENPSPSHAEGGGSNQIPNRSVVALIISTIENEAKRNREQQHTHQKKTINRENATIFVLVLTLVALSATCWAIVQQVIEMQKAYEVSRAQISSYLTLEEPPDFTIQLLGNGELQAHLNVVNNGGSSARQIVIEVFSITNPRGFFFVPGRRGFQIINDIGVGKSSPVLINVDGPIPDVWKAFRRNGGVLSVITQLHFCEHIYRANLQ
jgi:hypothetical protein